MEFLSARFSSEDIAKIEIDGINDYFVSRFGCVYDCKGKLMKTTKNRKGYERI